MIINTNLSIRNDYLAFNNLIAKDRLREGNALEIFYAPIAGIDLLNTGFIVTDTLAWASAKPTHPDKGWLILWQNRPQDLREHYYPVSKSNIAKVKEVDIISEVFGCLERYGLANNFQISNNVLEHPRVWRMWSEAFKQYEITIGAKNGH